MRKLPGETEFKRELREAFTRAKADGWRCQLVPVENPSIPGTPDREYCVEGETGWIELKSTLKIPRGKFLPPSFTAQQALWMRQRTEAGGRVWLLWRLADYRLLIRCHALIRGGWQPLEPRTEDAWRLISTKPLRNLVADRQVLFEWLSAGNAPRS